LLLLRTDKKPAQLRQLFSVTGIQPPNLPDTEDSIIPELACWREIVEKGTAASPRFAFWDYCLKSP